MKVVDISGWNTDIDWSRLVDEGVEGVIVKISEGCTLSEFHSKQIADAAARGLKWGVYCYTHAQTAARAEEEAEAVMDALDVLDYGAPELGIWFDVEAPEVLALGKEELTAACSAFISACNAKDYQAGIYASLYTLETFIGVEDLADYVPYWCAQYGASECGFRDSYPGNILAGWQWTDCYSIGGENYDMSEWY